MAPLLPAWKTTPQPIIGMLHLPPLPGAPRCNANLVSVIEQVLTDAARLTDGGVDGFMLENFGDTPFYPRGVPAWVVAQMTRVAYEVRQRHKLPLGVNVLRNDGPSALAIAHAVGAEFIRVNVLCGARVTDQGLIQGIAHHLLRDRARLDARHIRILADVDVKHSSPLGRPRPIEDEVVETLQRGGADAVIITGSATGEGTDVDRVRRASKAAGDAPVWVGSGVTAETLPLLLPFARGFIVGTSLKEDGLTTNPVDVKRVRELVAARDRA